MNRQRLRWPLGLVGLFFVALAFFQILASNQGLKIVRVKVDSLPLIVISPDGEENSERPVVLLGHGFAGSGAMMRGFAYTLAHAGYVAVAWDFNGHGMNPTPLGEGELVDAPLKAVSYIEDQGWAGDLLMLKLIAVQNKSYFGQVLL